MNAGGKIFDVLKDPELGKKLKKFAEKYNKEVSLVSQNGENFGTVRQGIIDRLNNFKSFDNFRFKNNAEKEAVDNFIKSSTVQVPIGDKEYSFSYNGYKAIRNGDWQNYSPAENEKEGFDAFKSYPMFDLITTGTDGKEKNWGKISYNANEALKNGKTYSSSFGDEMGVLNSYYSEIEKNKPKSYDELYSEAMQRIIDKAKANPSAQGIMNPDIEDPSYYLQFISEIDKEKIWQEFDNKLVGAIKTEADKVHFRTLVQNRMETLDRLRNTEYRDNKEMRNYIDGLYTHFKIIRDTADNQRIESIGAEVTTAYEKNVESESSEYVPQTDLAKSDNIKINISSLSSAEKYDFINLLHSPSLIMKKSFDLKEGWMSTKADLKNVLWLYLTPEEVNVYNKNYAEDPKKAEKYLEEMEGVLKNRRRVTNESISKDESAEEYQQGKESPFVGGIASIGRNLGGSIVALGDNIIDLINTGEINTYDDTGMFLRETQALKAGGSQHMKENYGTVAQFVYDTGLSILENALVIVTTKGVGNAAGLGTKAVSGLSGATMAMSAASNQMLSVADRGGNTAQILVGGLAAGAAEYIFEKFSIEKLLSPGSGKFVKDILKQSGVEASEELFTEVANIITDTAIMGEKSESNLRERELILNDGLTAEEAMKKVFLENLDRVLQAGIAGGISGGVMSGVMRGAEYRTQRAIEKNITNNATLPNVVKIIGEIEGRNPDYYTSQEAIDTANAVLKMTNGTATKADYALIERSEGARTVILSAEGTKAWESLKTEADKRMRSAEYKMRKENSSETEGASPFPTAKGEGFDVRSEGKSATISDGEIISNGERVTIDKASKVAGNVVLDEESYNFRKMNKVGYKAIQTMAKDLGMKVKYVDGLTDSEGKALDGVITSEGIFINTQSKNPTRWAATHEFSHRMKQTGGKMWQRYQDYVISHLKETGKYEERYNLKKGAYAENEIDEEIAADYIGKMFADVKELSDFIRRNRKDAFGIRNAYYKVLDKLGLLDEKKKAQAMWAKAYREAMKNSDAKYEGGAHESKSGTRVSENSDLKSDDSGGKMKVNNNLSESGERNESKNTKALGTDGTGQNNDSIWERSNDSEKVYRSMGGVQEISRNGKGNGWGFIPWSGRIQSYDLNSSREKERAYGILRKISEGQIKGKDTLGRNISQQVQKYFSNTVIKTEDGLLIPLYHATDNEFDVFEYGDFGFHVGSAEQAMYLDKKYIKEVYVNIKNPLFINSDTMSWPGLAVASHALSQGIITLDEFNSLYKMNGFIGKDYNSEANKAIRKLLKEKGYDGIIYPNDFEGKGISAIAFDSEQIKYTSNQNPTINRDLRKSVAGTRVEESSVSEDKSDYNQFLNDNGGGLHTFRPAKEKGWLSQQWITNRSEGNEEIAKSLNKISDIISNDFGVPINNRSFSDKDVAGSFNLTAEAIHTRAKNDIITLSHEVGHLLDKKLKLQKLYGIEKLTENFDRTLAALGYGEKSRKAEAVGEFVRMYLTNKEVAKAFCPEYFEAFENAIEKSDYKKAVEKLSVAVNAYLSAKTNERIDLAISDKTKEKSIQNKLAEIKKKFPELWNKFQYEFVDRYYAIGRAQGKVYAKNPEGKYDAHTLATNSLNSAARSAYILTKSFVTIEGEEIGKSFIDCLAPIGDKKAGIRKKNISELNRYLVLKHALEWIDPKTEGAHKKRVFADESLENPEVLKAEIEKIEKDLPGVKEAAENIYQYIRNLKKYWGIDAGLMTQELSDKLDKMYPNYVPFFREGDPKTITGARTNLANQRAPILEASGGEGMIVNPLESIIGLTNKYVKTASRNMAMQAIAHMADNVGGTGFIIERANGEQQSALEGNEILEGKADAPEASPEELRSITTEEDVWTKATKNGKGFASVLIDGERVWYQINDEQLFNAVADMEPKRLNAFFRGCNVALNVKRALITSNNPLFAATNAVRDAITAYNNIDINNPFSYLRAYFTAFYHVIRKNPNYKRWCAMGGGHSSELSANMDAVKRELGKAMRNPKAKAFSWIIHPIQAIASVNDAIESTPRLMAFEHEMKKSGDVHKAINKADDITTNFKRGGRTAKNLNNMFMFSNAAIQGLDRTLRSFTKNETEHGLRNRIIKYSVVATFFTVLQMAINRRDEESKEDYKNLSSYMKHSNYVISIGGGKFLRIPTAREQDMLRVIIADAVNYAFGDKEAFDGLLGFAVDTLWPWYVELPQNTDGKSMLDIMTEMFINTARNTPFGFLTDFAANYDFTGKPIVSSKYDDVPRKEQYDERTSKLAVWLGKLTNESPLKIDYIINSNFGILGTINKSLFPMDKSQKDKSIGFISRWVSDSYYSTDVLDKVYSKNEAAKMKFQGDGSGKNLAEYKKTSMAADFITQYNKAVKALPEEEKRAARKRLLDIINNWGNGKSASEEELIRLYDATGDDMFITAPKLSITTTTGKRDMTADEYVELVEKYTAGYEALFAEVIASEKYKNADDYTKVELLKDADSYALNSAKAEIFPDFEMPKWQTEIFEGKATASETFFGRVEADAFDSAKKEWSDNNFNFDESAYSEAEVSSMNEFEESAAAFYTSHEMNIPYEEGKYRRVQVYHDYLKDVMSLEEFAGIKAYANKVASTMGEGSTDSMSSKELQAYLNTLDYDTKTKGALFEAIADKGWKNPYSGGKVGDGTRFPVITTSPVAGEKSEVQAPESEEKTENAKPPEALPGGYTGGRTTNNSSKTENKVVTISYDASAFTQRGIAEIKKVENDANSYYNSPTQSDYTNNPLRHMHVYKTQLSKYMNLNDYAKIRAFVMESAKNSTVTADSLEKYLSSTDYTKSIKASLFEAIGDVNWVNPFKE